MVRRVATVLLVVGGAIFFPRAGAADSDAVKRGEALFAAADCTGCHTDAKGGGQPLAGGPPLVTPFGTFYAPNITSDREYGIGAWSETEFHNALRHGVGRRGQYLYPVFPFPSFTGMSDGDIADLFAYLQSRPAVAQPNKPQAATPPFGWRFLLLGWRILFFREGPLQPVPGKSEEWNRGRYLAEAVAHCPECHTPRNMFGALKTSLAFSGNPNGPDNQKAPNITGDAESGIGKWSADDVATLLKTGQTPDFDFVGSGMSQVVKGTETLSDADRHAISVYIKSLPAIHTARAEKKPAS
ncbi:MAG TPA: cytochrome c [Stellaceae bacterium]|nr:cytochrome c [Stellaceae bacterium]